MRHTTTAVAVLLLALTTAGCGSSDSGDGKPAAASKPSTSPKARFLDDAHSIAFTGDGPTDAELADFPPQWCQGLQDGHSIDWLFSSGGGNLYPLGNGWGTVEKNANQLLVAGVKAYCPTQLDGVTAQLRAAGEY